MPDERIQGCAVSARDAFITATIKDIMLGNPTDDTGRVVEFIGTLWDKHQAGVSPDIAWTPKSGHIGPCLYRPSTRELFVQFKTSGAHWRYDGVPLEVIDEWSRAESAGSFFHHEIRKRGYKATPVTGPLDLADALAASVKNAFADGSPDAPAPRDREYERP